MPVELVELTELDRTPPSASGYAVSMSEPARARASRLAAICVGTSCRTSTGRSHTNSSSAALSSSVATPTAARMVGHRPPRGVWTEFVTERSMQLLIS